MFTTNLFSKVLENGRGDPHSKDRKTWNITSYSHLDVLGKILDKVQYHLLENIIKHDIIISQQFGFRQNYSAIQ